MESFSGDAEEGTEDLAGEIKSLKIKIKRRIIMTEDEKVK